MTSRPFRSVSAPRTLGTITMTSTTTTATGFNEDAAGWNWTTGIPEIPSYRHKVRVKNPAAQQLTLEFFNRDANDAYSIHTEVIPGSGKVEFEITGWLDGPERKARVEGTYASGTATPVLTVIAI